MTATGGTLPYIAWGATGLPPGMSINITTGQITGTPRLEANGAGGTAAASVNLSVTDSTPTTASRTVGLQVLDPGGPFIVSAGATTLNATAVGSVNTTITSSGTGIGAVSYTATVPTPALPPEVTFNVSAVGVATLTRSAAGATGSSTVTVTMADTGCGGTRHQGSVDLTLDY